MGLSERKKKQRIGADPRNLAWAENAAKFGHTYLAKHGWNPSMGLGVAGDGRTTHIAVAQKLDQLGIGAGRPDGPDAIAWKQAKEFEGLLERLNASEKPEAIEPTEDTESKQDSTDEKESKAERKSRRKEEKRKAKAALDTSTEATPVVAPAPGRLAHRARFLAAKRLAGVSSTALSEILGVSPSPSTPSGSTPAPSSNTLTEIPALDDTNQITTSTQSVADYFRGKMRAKAQGTSSTSTPIVTFEEPSVEEDVPKAGLGMSRWGGETENKEVLDRPNGLGFTTCAVTGLESTCAAVSSPATPALPVDDRQSKREKKRKRKEAEQVVMTADTNTVGDETDSDRRAAKRARKEARRAARQQREVQANEVAHIEADSSPKKRKTRCV